MFCPNWPGLARSCLPKPSTSCSLQAPSKSPAGQVPHQSRLHSLQPPASQIPSHSRCHPGGHPRLPPSLQPPHTLTVTAVQARPSPHMPSHLLPNVQLPSLPPSLQHSHCTPHFRQPKCVSIVGTTWAGDCLGRRRGGAGTTTWGRRRGDDDVGTTTTTTTTTTMRRRHSGGDECAGSRCITAASQVHQTGRRQCAGPGARPVTRGRQNDNTATQYVHTIRRGATVTSPPSPPSRASPLPEDNAVEGRGDDDPTTRRRRRDDTTRRRDEETTLRRPDEALGAVTIAAAPSSLTVAAGPGRC